MSEAPPFPLFQPQRGIRGGFLVAVCALCLTGCRGESKPRSIAEIDAERMALPALFMTASGKQIKAPGNEGAFVDRETGEIAWPVYMCANPDCPGRTPDGPHLFIWQDARFYVGEDGTLAARNFDTAQQWREAVAAAGGYQQPTCDECLKIRDLDNETPEEAQKYAEYPQPYVLPETAERMKELDAENQERIEYINRRIRGGASEK